MNHEDARATVEHRDATGSGRDNDARNEPPTESSWAPRVVLYLNAVWMMGAGLYMAVDDSPHRWQLVYGVKLEVFMALLGSLMLILAKRFEKGQSYWAVPRFGIIDYLLLTATFCMQITVQQALSN